MFFYCFSVWQLLHRCSKGTRRRKRGKMRARHHPRHLPGGRISRRQRKGDRADSHKKNQVKCASNEMRFDSGINLFFHVGSLVKRSSSHFSCRLLVVYKKPPKNVNTMFCKFLGLSGGIRPTPKLHRHNSTGDVDCSENALLFCSQEPREQRQSDDLNRAFSAGIFGFH